MPPEQFGGYATPASDLYGLGATLIALATATQPADLPQKDMRIKFASLVNFTPAFVDWLEWLTEPSAEARLKTPMVALEALLKERTRNDEYQYLANNTANSPALVKPVNSIELFWDVMWRSIGIGGGMVTFSALLYSTVVYPVVGTTIGGYYGALIGFSLAFANGIVIWLITRFFFFPLKNVYLYRRVISMTSMTLSIAIALIYFNNIPSVISPPYGKFVFYVIAPSLITGLSMLLASKSIIRWYEDQHIKIKSEQSL